MNRPDRDPLSSVQMAELTQQEVAKLLTAPTAGALEIGWPATDDERVDLDAHIKERFGVRLSIQVKCVSFLVTRWKASHLVITFSEDRDRVISHPLYWYLLGHFDLPAMQFSDPVFFVESKKLHRHADPRVRGKTMRFTFDASMDPASNDQWRENACSPDQVGHRAMRILRQAHVETSLTREPALAVPGTIQVRLKASATAETRLSG